MSRILKIIALSLLTTSVLAVGIAEARGLVFKKTKIVVFESDKTKERKAIVTWSDSTVTLRFKDADDSVRHPGIEGTFRYDQMSGLTYERSKHSRIAAALLVTPFLIFSKRKHHWLSWNYVEADSSKRSILLRIDKKEEKIYRSQVPILTGLEMETIVED